MKLEYDREADAVYIYVQEKEVFRTVEFSEGVNIDVDEEGKLIGLEILDATKRYSLKDIFDLRTENFILDEVILNRRTAGGVSGELIGDETTR
jgi:uncharacterized protein YuzE